MKTPAHIEKDNARFLKAFPQLAEPKPVCADSIDPAIEHARREAAALAWSTDYPFLVLPCLTEELERKVVAYSEKQRQVREHSELLFPTAFPIAAQQIAA